MANAMLDLMGLGLVAHAMELAEHAEKFENNYAAGASKGPQIDPRKQLDPRAAMKPR